MPEQEQVEAMIKESVDLLSPFAEADDGKYTKAHCDALGRNEGLFTHLRLVALDSDGDGKLSPDEYERYCAEGQQLVDAYLSFFINGGVVSALLFSIVFPMAFDMEIDGLGWDDDYGALGAKQWLGICAYLFSMLSCGMCFVMLVYTGSMYSQLSFWMPNLNCQLWYVSKVVHMMTTLNTTMVLIYIFTAAAMLFQGLSANAWVGIFGVLPFAMCAGPAAHWYGWFANCIITPQMQLEARRLLHAKASERSRSMPG
uniref:EF-hand domain-containing protein n=1 Tax=Prymnesium polylepis TaxID=72548 RepID=A0A6T8D3L9_9EUKA